MEHQEKQVTNNSPAKSTNSSLHPDQSKVGARPRTRSWDGFSNLPNNHPGSQLQFNALKCAMSPAECKKTARLPLPLVQAKFGKEPGEDPTSILPPDRKDSTIFETWRKRNYTSPKIFNRNSLFPYNHGPVTRYQQSDPTREVRLLQSENLSQNHRHTVAPVLSTFSPKVTKKPGYSNAVVTNPTVLPMHMSQPLGANRDCLINPTQKRCHSEPPPEARFVAQAKDKIPEMAKQPHQIFGTSLKQTPNVNKPNELTSITDRLQQRSEEAALSALSLNPTFPIIKNSFGDRKASEISKVADDHLPKRTAPSTEILRLSFTSVPNSSATQNQACTTVTTFASGFEPLTVYRPTLSPTSRPASAALNDQEMTLGRKSVNRYNSWNNRMLSHDFETLNVPEPDRDLLIHSSSLSRQRDVPSLRVDRPFIPYLNEQTMTGYLRVGTNSDLQPSMPKESSRIAQALKNQTPESSQSRLNSVTMRSTFKSATSVNHNEDDEDENAEDEGLSDRASSIGPLTCADEDDLLSTRSMPRGGRISQNVCEALHLMLSRLWSCLPPQAAPPSNPCELNTQESAGRVVCYLLQQLRFRRALLFSLEAEAEQPRRLALSILSDSLSASRHLISSTQRPLAQLGLQLVRLLLAFVGLGSVCLTELVQTLQSLHTTQKRPLRFAVKTILEKMIKKFGRKTIQSMTSLEYQKVVRNSARIMARRDRRQRAGFDTVRELEEDNATSVKSKTRNPLTRRCRPSVAPSISSRSHISLPPRIHVPRFEELLAASSDEDDHLHERKSTGSIRSAVSSRRSVKTATTRPKSLVEELESLVETTGLCRRSRQRVLRGTENLDDDIVERGTVAGTTGIRRKVRFADAASVASASRLEGKRSRMARGTSQNSDLWLVEQPEIEDIVDLSDARALARHTAFAADAETARAMTDALRKTEVKADTRPQSDRVSPFPVVDGKIVIDGNAHKTGSGHTTDQDWHLQDSDEEDSKPGVGAWSTQNQTRLARSRIGKTAQARIPGQIYTSTKAKGDMRRAGQPDPYAYIALGSGLGGVGKIATALERRRLLRAVGLGKRKHAKNKNPSAICSGGIQRRPKKRAQRK